MSDAQPKKRIGDQLIDKGIISLDQLKIALQEQKISGNQLGKVLIDMGFLTESLLKEVLSDGVSDETINLEEVVPDEDAIALIKKSLAEQLNVLPCNYNKKNKTLQLAMADTFDIIALDKIKSIIPADILVMPILAGIKEIQSNICLLYTSPSPRD